MAGTLWHRWKRSQLKYLYERKQYEEQRAEKEKSVEDKKHGHQVFPESLEKRRCGNTV